MHTKLKAFVVVNLLTALCLSGYAQSTAFTYQGRLNSATNVATGIFDLRFGLWNSADVNNSTQVGLLTNSATPVSNGLFTVTLDYGSVNFTGADRWLELAVRTNGGGAFSTLSPRQLITPTPYALRAINATAALTATTANSVAASNLVGTVSGSQIAAGSIGATQLSNSVSLWNRSVTNISYSAGNVGVGTDTPGANLDVNGVINASGSIHVGSYNPDGTPKLIRFGDGNFVSIGENTVDDHMELTAGAFVFNGGNVGIGTNSPQWPLHVVGAGGGSSGIIAAETTGGNGGPQLRLKVGGPFSQEWVFVANGNINGSVGDFQIVQQAGGSRMVITTNGNVGIGTATPNSDSRLQVKGMVRLGSETGTSEAPDKSILVRRVKSTSSATGQVVAKSIGGIMTLERDGTAGGLIIKITGIYTGVEIAASGINASGVTVNFYSFLPGGGTGNTTTTIPIFTDAQKIGYCRIMFGDAVNSSDMTTVELMRAVDNFSNNFPQWVGTVTSTLNQ